MVSEYFFINIGNKFYPIHVVPTSNLSYRAIWEMVKNDFVTICMEFFFFFQVCFASTSVALSAALKFSFRVTTKLKFKMIFSSQIA